MSEKKLFYKTIQQPTVAEFKDRGSKFLAYAFPLTDVQDFKAQLAILKKEHPKAVHFCFAYRLGNDGNHFRSSDDGEPSGSAGKPILGQLDSKEVVDTAVIVVRYFGGTLLGVPGLINAYKTAASLALQLTPIIQKPVMQRCIIEFDYTQMNEVQRWIKNFQAVILQQQQQLFCHITVDIPLSRLEEAGVIFTKLNGVTFSPLKVK